MLLFESRAGSLGKSRVDTSERGVSLGSIDAFTTHRILCLAFCTCARNAHILLTIKQGMSGRSSRDRRRSESAWLFRKDRHVTGTCDFLIDGRLPLHVVVIVSFRYMQIQRRRSGGRPHSTTSILLPIAGPKFLHCGHRSHLRRLPDCRVGEGTDTLAI